MPPKAAADQVEEPVVEESVETPEVGAYSDLTKEKKAAYIAGLKREKDGYSARIDQAKAVSDDDQVKVLEGRVEQVARELKKVSSAKVVESTVVVDDEA